MVWRPRSQYVHRPGKPGAMDENYPEVGVRLWVQGHFRQVAPPNKTYLFRAALRRYTHASSCYI